MDADSTTPPLDADLTSDAGLTSDDEPLVMGLPVILPTQTEYRCPGESHSIPRSVCHGSPLSTRGVGNASTDPTRGNCLRKRSREFSRSSGASRRSRPFFRRTAFAAFS